MNIKIEIDKIMHFLGGVIGWMYFYYIFWGGLSEKHSHLIVFIGGGLWELYFRLKGKDEFDLVDWGFVCLGAFAIHCISLHLSVYSLIGYGICLLVYLQLRKLWW